MSEKKTVVHHAELTEVRVHQTSAHRAAQYLTAHIVEWGRSSWGRSTRKENERKKAVKTTCYVCISS